MLFAQSELAIMDYNRVIKDLNGLTQDEFIAKISESFTVESAPASPYKPQEKHTFGMYLGGKWYKLTAKDGTFDASTRSQRSMFRYFSRISSLPCSE